MNHPHAIPPGLEEWHDLLMNAPVGVFTSTPEGRILYANQAFARLYGFETPRAMIETVTEVGSQLYAESSDREQFRQQLQTHGRVVNYECRMVRRDGSIFWASLNARVVREQKGGTESFQGYITDISDRRRAEQKSRCSEEKFTIVFMSAPNCMAIVRLVDGVVHDVNQAFEQVTGWQRSDVIGKTSSESGFWVNAKEREAMVGELARGRDVLQREFGFRNRNGEPRDGLYSARPIQIEDQPYYIFILQDITESKRVEESLRLTQFAMDQAPDSILWVDHQGALIYANRAACSSTGFTKEELLRMKVFDVDPDFPDSKWEQHKVDLRRLEKMTFEGRHKRKNGQPYPVEVTTNYIEYKGRFLGIAFDRDISERKKYEEEREKMQNRLFQAQKMESLGILAGGVAHDFNNLLQIIGGNLELLLSSKYPEDTDMPRLKTVIWSIERAGKLVQQLLLFGRKAVTQRKPLDLNHEVDEAIKILERTIPKMILISRHLASNLWSVSADSVQVEQVLLNLGTNAVDAMPNGGKLLVETKNIVLDVGPVSGEADAEPGRYVLLTVTDSGCGMTRETINHVFDPFFTTKEVGKGTGLGLASTYGIVKSHGGHIQCYSEPGQGTTFKIYWPALAQDGLHSELPSSSDEPQGGDESILVVDDEPEILKLSREILETFGYRVFTAETGERALEIHAQQQGKIDVVLLDLNMPGMGGTNCLLHLLAEDPSAKVIIASGYSENGQGRDALSIGAKGFIGKPYQMKELAAKIRAILDH